VKVLICEEEVERTEVEDRILVLPSVVVVNLVHSSRQRFLGEPKRVPLQMRNFNENDSALCHALPLGLVQGVGTQPSTWHFNRAGIAANGTLDPILSHENALRVPLQMHHFNEDDSALCHALPLGLVQGVGTQPSTWHVYRAGFAANGTLDPTMSAHGKVEKSVIAVPIKTVIQTNSCLARRTFYWLQCVDNTASGVGSRKMRWQGRYLPNPETSFYFERRAQTAREHSPLAIPVTPSR